MRCGPHTSTSVGAEDYVPGVEESEHPQYTHHSHNPSVLVESVARVSDPHRAFVLDQSEECERRAETAHAPQEE